MNCLPEYTKNAVVEGVKLQIVGGNVDIETVCHNLPMSSITLTTGNITRQRRIEADTPHTLTLAIGAVWCLFRLLRPFQ